VFFLKNARALLRAIKKISRDETQICAELCEIRTRLKREGLGVGGGGGGGAVTLCRPSSFSLVLLLFLSFLAF
jgi:hypothetical protein